MVVSMKAQQNDLPKFFRNTLEKCLYEAEHPESIGNPNKMHHFNRDFTARLDSVVGSDDFDWAQWKSDRDGKQSLATFRQKRIQI